MSRLQTSVTGVQEAMAKLREIGAEGERIASREVVAAALDVQATAKTIITETEAVDTGRLRNSIAVAESETGVVSQSNAATGGPPGSGEGTEATNAIRPGMLSAWIGTNVEYAKEIHFGARGMAARPFLVPSVEEHRPKLLRRLRAEIKALERA